MTRLYSEADYETVHREINKKAVSKHKCVLIRAFEYPHSTARTLNLWDESFIRVYFVCVRILPQQSYYVKQI